MTMVKSERRGAVALLTLDNPEKYNALGGALLADLRAAFEAAEADSGTRAVVLTGAGKGFCAGAQLGTATFEAGAEVGDWMRASINPLIEKVRASRLPVVVAVNGPAAGAGVGLALMGDIVLAARSARFVLSFVGLGAALDGGTTVFLQRAIGAPRTRALALLGEPLSAETAAVWGLVWKVVADDDLMREASALAERLANGPPASIALIKAQLESAWSAGLAEVLDAEASAQSTAFATDDLREGAAAFMEKRTPRFSGAMRARGVKPAKGD
ncbi:enoyl-CoA hydratase/carnithine racemase [Roseiarcus fermentans]|uniref:Enoyl-CoA hydratase/carnithine racemase n=1 Tax=Roseiarcus fermentans TaxID=1473586 RepID=A0A366EJ64_9HYPH|nr:enoyl-CoA hydratase-related protein [Roseiarcus fermentans]RBP02452.1 enoyl-CoA hydratase/carnithine racemase [Roseiarcus fermentans]